MTALSPTRISIYDFLIEDTLQIDSIFADSANISIPQARLAIVNGIQAITSGLLAFEQRHGPSAIQKKIFNRFQINEIRKYNAFNLITMDEVDTFGSQNLDILFESNNVQIEIFNKIAQITSLTTTQTKHLLGNLTSICIRELAILADFSKLDSAEISHWFKLQPQFLCLKREGELSSIGNENAIHDYWKKIPEFDLSWHKITGYRTSDDSDCSNTNDMPNYAKVIGRTSETKVLTSTKTEPSQTEPSMTQPSKLIDEQPNSLNNNQIIVDTDNNSDVLEFSHIENISLPYQRWLLQLAKVSDIYLSRKRLKIAPEPVKKPVRPLVNLRFLDRQKALSKDTDTTEYNSIHFWKNPILLTLVVIIGILSLMAFAKFYYKNTYLNNQIEDPFIHQLDG